MTRAKGTSGNPKERKAGPTHRVTAELREIVPKDPKEIVKSVIDQAKAGDIGEPRRLPSPPLPQSKWPAPFDLPPIDGPGDIPQAVNMLLAATASAHPRKGRQ